MAYGWLNPEIVGCVVVGVVVPEKIWRQLGVKGVRAWARSRKAPVQVLRLESPGSSPETSRKAPVQVLRLESSGDFPVQSRDFKESPSSSPETGKPRFKSWDWKAPVQVLRLLTFWLIAMDKLLTPGFPCSASSVNWYQLVMLYIYKIFCVRQLTHDTKAD